MPALIERSNKGLHQYTFKWLQQHQLVSLQTELLDIGCGSGAWLQRFQAVGATHLMGIDLDTQQFVPQDIRSLALNLDSYNGQVWDSFNLITALEIIEHVSNPGLLMQLAANNLVSGGYLCITTPNIHGLPQRLRYLFTGKLSHFDTKSDPTHIYPVYLDNLRKLATQHQFKLVEIAAFPAKGYYNFKASTLRLAAILKPFCKDEIPGDNLLILLQKQ